MSDGPLVLQPADCARRWRALVTGGVGPGLPRRQADRWILLHEAAACVGDAPLREVELNARIADWLAAAGPRVELDHVSVRRALVDEGFVTRARDGSSYARSAAHERRVVFAT
jgi:hypothetical protein